MIKQRNIGICILLSIVTCGIYDHNGRMCMELIRRNPDVTV